MSMTIFGRVVDGNHPLFVIAELGLNHGGDLTRALHLVDAAAGAGASAVKVQSFRADRLVASSCPPPAHVEETSLRSFFRGFELDRRAHEAIAERAHRQGLALVATPFDEEVVQMLEAVECDAYKVASGDLTHRALIERVAATQKPLVLSTGMGTSEEIRRAVAWARAAGGAQIAVLHCVSAYPVPSGQENIQAVAELGRTLGVPVGLSDHSIEPLSVPLAVALGASLYERHLALDDDEDQIERALSSTPSELRTIIHTAAQARQVLGDGMKVCRGAESANRTASRRSLHAARALVAGERLEAAATVALRPGTGIEPYRLPDVIGCRVVRDIAPGQPLTAADLESAFQGECREVA